MGASSHHGHLWFGSTLLYGLAAGKLGDWGAILGWPLFMSLIVITATILGSFAGEWKGCAPIAIRIQWIGVTVMVLADFCPRKLDPLREVISNRELNRVLALSLDMGGTHIGRGNTGLLGAVPQWNCHLAHYCPYSGRSTVAKRGTPGIATVILWWAGLWLLFAARSLRGARAVPYRFRTMWLPRLKPFQYFLFLHVIASQLATRLTGRRWLRQDTDDLVRPPHLPMIDVAKRVTGNGSEVLRR